MKPKRIQRRRSKGWRMPEGVVYVGRPTKWGNLFGWDRNHSRATVVSHFQKWLKGDLFPLFEQNKREYIVDNIDQLRGSDLACWCPLDEPCHADVLLELANQEATYEA